MSDFCVVCSVFEIILRFYPFRLLHLKNEQLSFIHYQLGACEFLEVSSDKVERTLEEIYTIYSVFCCI